MKKAIWLSWLLVLTASILYADGIPFKGDEYDGPTITLWPDKPINQSSEKYVLNANQQKAIFNHTGVRVHSLDLLSLEYAKDTCTCDILNIGIVYKNNRIVIPIDYIGPDSDNTFQGSDKVFTNLVIGNHPGTPISKYLIVSGLVLIIYLFIIIMIIKIRNAIRRKVRK
jgi:hypothetical protein